MANEKLLLKIEEAGQMLSVGRAKAYLMAASGEIPTVKMGRSIRVPLAKLREWVERQVEAAEVR